jgi:site-specific DNA recombinase
MGIEPVATSPTATLFFSLLASFAEFERARICERVAEGKAAKAARGGHTGGPTPRGYRKIGTGSSSIIVEDAQEREAIKMVRELIRDNRLLAKRPSKLAQRLAMEGLMGRDGKPYGRMAVWRMLHEPTAKMVTAEVEPIRCL